MKTKLLFIALLCVFSCKCKIENTKIENTEKKSTKMDLIASGNLYGSGDEGIVSQNLIITNQNDWNKLISEMNSVNKVSDSFTETVFDFSKYTIIAVFDSVKSSGGHNIELDVTKTSKNIIVNVTKVASRGNATSVMTQPYRIGKIAKSDLPIEFVTSL